MSPTPIIPAPAASGPCNTIPELYHWPLLPFFGVQGIQPRALSILGRHFPSKPYILVWCVFIFSVSENLKGYLIWFLINGLWKWYISSFQKFHLSTGYPVSCELNGSMPCRKRYPSPQHWGVGGLWPSPLIIEYNFSSWRDILVGLHIFLLASVWPV